MFFVPDKSNKPECRLYAAKYSSSSHKHILTDANDAYRGKSRRPPTIPEQIVS